MGAFDIACPVCGAPTVQPDDKHEWLIENEKLLKWLSNLVAIRQNLQPFFGTYDSYGRVEQGESVTRSSVDIYREDAIGLHQGCWELLGKPDYDWFMKYHITSGDDKYLPPFREYSDQFYDWEAFIDNDTDLWAAFDPSLTGGERNRKRIVKRIDEVKARYS